MTAVTFVFVLLAVYQLKHFLADYPLQTPYMLGKFQPGWEFVKPLAAHAAVHAFLTALIVVIATRWTHPGLAACLAAFDFVVHFTMDRIKASPQLMGRWKALTKEEYKIFLYDSTHPMNASIRVGAHYVRMTPDKFHKEVIDQAKTKLRGNTLFWWALGFDQAVHHLTHYAIIAALVYFRG